MLPMITLGVTTGAIFYRTMPDLAILLLLILLLIALVVMNSCKLRKMCGEEKNGVIE
jgi:hypothetical protein